MRRVLLIGGLVLVAGCQGLVGPRQRSAQPVLIDDPRLSTAEQEKRGREFLALPEKSPDIAPRTGAEDPYYRRVER